MRKYLIAVLAVVGLLSFGAIGAAQDAPLAPQSEVCTPYFPDPAVNGGTCTNPVYACCITTSGWKVSPSYARRTSSGIQSTTTCLDSTARWRIQYLSQSGQVLNSAASSWGKCGGFLWNGDSSSGGGEPQYAKVRCQIQSGYTFSAVGYCWSTWY